ncbi:MAG: bifunctional UDP-N-acetylglucosamine diphosphorylase/glucosamine-1-phosphate N-acetyltransferase GlmU [Clostridia bacterium]|nr:bifunctional UDP-N-acetylglucosamine diphosphorylase/glucosamine-1-phosphate N-acetyltransferase GlmU [Clostridia bacterium]
MALNSAVILAAGAGTRMKSKIPKVLHQLCGHSMIDHVIRAVKASHINDIIVIIGSGADQVEKKLEKSDVQFVLQKEQLGTGHAVQQAKDKIPNQGNVIVLYGDMPMLSSETIKAFMAFHETEKNDLSVLTAKVENPYGYGRIVKNHKGEMIKIVEHKDADEEELLIDEINSGVYCFDAPFLKKHLHDIDNNNNQKEYYLPDLISIAVKNQYKLGTYQTLNSEELMGVNSRKQLMEADAAMRKKINEKWMDEGVTIINPEHTYIDPDVKIGIDTVIYPGATLKGNTIIGEDCMIGQNTRIENSIIKNRVEIQSSVILDSRVDEATTIGPFAYLRPGSNIGKNVKIGDFVEIKNAAIGDGSKASHLAYVGDAEVGKNVNIGCGVIFVNYNGKEKQKIVVEDDAFVGSNVNLVAPVVVKNKGYVAAGTTVTMEVPEGALCIGRGKQRHIDGWVDRKNIKKK